MPDLHLPASARHNSKRSIILVPAKAPLAKLAQIVMYGANDCPVNGTYDDAFDLSVRSLGVIWIYITEIRHYNPLTIEGKKTVSFEIFSQLECKDSRPCLCSYR